MLLYSARFEQEGAGVEARWKSLGVGVLVLAMNFEPMVLGVERVWGEVMWERWLRRAVSLESESAKAAKVRVRLWVVAVLEPSLRGLLRLNLRLDWGLRLRFSELIGID